MEIVLVCTVAGVLVLWAYAVSVGRKTESVNVENGKLSESLKQLNVENGKLSESLKKLNERLVALETDPRQAATAKEQEPSEHAGSWQVTKNRAEQGARNAI